MLSFFFLFLLFLMGPTLSSARHSIAISSTVPLRLSSLAWDPIGKNFLVGSTEGPIIYAVSNSGIVRCLVSDISPNSTGASVAAVVVDHTATGKIFKIKSNDGTMKKVTSSDNSDILAPSGNAIALHNDLSLTVAANRNLLLLQSDGTRIRASVKGNITVKHHDQSIAVATQEGKKAYALIESPHGYRIEELQWWKFPLFHCLFYICFGGCLIWTAALFRKIYTIAQATDERA